MTEKRRHRGLIGSWVVILSTFAWLWAGVVNGASATDTRFNDDLLAEERSVPQDQLPTLTQESSLVDYLTYAEMNNPGLKAASMRWKAALEKVPQVTAYPDPRFTYRYYVRNVETRVGPQEQGFGLAQMFPWFGKLRLRGDAAMAAAEAAHQRVQAERLRLYYRVKEAYYEYYYLSRAIAVVRENVNLVKYLESVVRALYKVAKAKHPDVIRAQVELGKLEDRVRSLSDLRGPIVARLNAALNRPPGAMLPWPKEIPFHRTQFTDEDVYAWLRDANPELQALQHEVQRQSHRIDLAKKDYYPDITLGVNYVDTGGARMRNVPDSSKDPIIGMVSINLPIWLGKRSAGVREARMRRGAAARAREEMANKLVSKARLVLYRLQDAARKLDLYGNTLIPKANESLRATDTSYRAGKSTFLSLIDSERVLLEFQLSYERALADHAQRLAELEMLVGRELPKAPAEPEESDVPAGTDKEKED